MISCKSWTCEIGVYRFSIATHLMPNFWEFCTFHRPIPQYGTLLRPYDKSLIWYKNEPSYLTTFVLAVSGECLGYNEVSNTQLTSIGYSQCPKVDREFNNTSHCKGEDLYIHIANHIICFISTGMKHPRWYGTILGALNQEIRCRCCRSDLPFCRPQTCSV